MIDLTSDVSAHIVGCIREVADPELVLLFGSRARGDAAPDSDYDIMVVVQDGSSAELLGRQVHKRLASSGIASDVLMRTARDYVANQNDPGLLDFMVARQGRVLFSSARLPQRTPPSAVREPTPRGGLRMWIRRANSDFRTAEQLMVAADPTYDAICFHAHACVEKLLKASIILRGEFPPRTHGLAQLLAMQPDAIRGDAALADACALLMDVLPRARYPELPEPTAGQAAQAIAAARAARGILLASLEHMEG